MRWLALAGAVWAGTAQANPMNLARFSGLDAGPMHEGAFSIYWNPAAIARPGGRIGLHGLGVARQASYFRPAEENDVPPEEAGANAGKATLVGGGFIPAVGGGYGWELGDFVLGTAGGVYIASAGNTHWEKDHSAPERFPGAVDGPQRWHSMDTNLVILSTSVGFGLQHRPTGLSFGVAPVLNFAFLEIVRARNPDKSQRLFDDAGRLSEGRILLQDGFDTGVSFVAGARWDATEDIAFGVTWHHGVEYDLEGDAYISFGVAPESRTKAVTNLPVADVLRVGSAISPTRWMTLRPSVEVGFWSVMDRQLALNQGQPCSIAPPGEPCGDADPARGEELIRIERDFENTYGFLLRNDFHLTPWLTLQLMGGYETGATPSETHEPGLAENDNWQLGGGAAFLITEQLRLSTSATWQQFLDAEVHDSVQEPLANGTYTDQRQFFTLDLEVLL